MKPTIDHALDWLAGGAIGPDKGLPVDPEMDLHAREVRACFQQYPGVLLLMLEMSLFRAPVDHRLETPEQYLRFAQNREGQNQLAAGMLQYIEHAKALERNDHERRNASDAHVGVTLSRTREPGPGSGGDDGGEWDGGGGDPLLGYSG